MWSFGAAFSALAVSALLVASAYITFSLTIDNRRSSDEKNISGTLPIRASDLVARLGVASAAKDKSLAVTQFAGDRAILTRHLTLQAQNFDFLTYRISDRNPTQRVYLIWRTAEKPADVFNARLPWSGNGLTTMRLTELPDWQGTITELGLDIYGDLRGQPLIISELNLSPDGVAEQLSAIRSDWTAFTGWTQKSINYLGNPKSTLPTPTQAAAAWAGLTLALLLLIRAPQRGQPLVVLGVAVFVPWLALDILWQRELNIQLAETQALFSGKTMDERHLADEDSEIYSYTKRLKQDILPVKPVRLFILHDSEEHNYERLKVQYYLLPHNIYNYGRLPPGTKIKPGDFILKLGEVPDLNYQQNPDRLVWGKTGKLAVTLLDNDSQGQLFEVRPAGPNIEEPDR